MAAAAVAPAPAPDPLREAVVAAIQEIYDPEIPVNIYDLGLIYDISIENGIVRIRMTLTAPNCPEAETIPPMVKARVEMIPEVKEACVAVVWEPSWGPEKISEAAKLELGLL